MTLGCSGTVSDASCPRGADCHAPGSIFSCSRVRIAPPVLTAFISPPGAAVTLASSQHRGWESGAPCFRLVIFFWGGAHLDPEQSQPAPTDPVPLT